VFLFWPLLAELRFDKLVKAAGYPGSKMVPAVSALLSLLALKLLDKERLSHIDDFNADAGLGLFAGLNVLPKKSFATDYSYRTARPQQEKLLRGWVSALSGRLFPDASSFSLDFHAIPYRGEQAVLDNHWLPRRGKAGPSVLALFAQERESRVLCYANANFTRETQPGAVREFARFWKGVTGSFPQWLYFDSRMAPYAELSWLNQNDIFFVTIRRRGAALLRRLNALPAGRWKTARIDIPKRQHRRIRYVDERVRLADYEGSLRQVAVRGLGREHPTLFLSNNTRVTPRDLVTNYARRNGIEDGIGSAVNFFHLDCLSSEVRLNVDLDAVLTVLANGCYHWLARRLNGYDSAKPKQLYRKFVETSGLVEIGEKEIAVTLDRRSHNPVLREAALDAEPVPIPWAGRKTLKLAFA
jgi:hypothetical protein